MARVVFAGDVATGVKARADVYLHGTVVSGIARLLKEVGLLKSSSVE